MDREWPFAPGVDLRSPTTLITSLRSFLENQGVRFGAEWVGKIKMVLQCAALIAIFAALEVSTASPFALFLSWAKDILIYAMLASTILSGLQYLWRSALLLKSDS